MRCKAVRVRAAQSEDGDMVVSMVVGNMRPVGCIDEVAWLELPIGMAREVAAELVRAADAVERRNR